MTTANMQRTEITEITEIKERVLGRALARELSIEELKNISGGHNPPPGSTCSGHDCDMPKKL